MRRRAYAHGARIARALRDSLTFHGAEAAVWASNSALSVSALGVSVCKSEDGSVLRKPIRHLYQTLRCVRPNHKTSILRGWGVCSTYI